ncbi:saccharopine dehydrogenase family protein [Salinisphaera orenii]|uniref:saccharopine dehydrogenase family protein n=1 Tax=Salinisphaera orenii TaxID=856731 RepID=UPI000DBE820F
MSQAKHEVFDLVLFGATSFVGRLVAEHLAARADAENLNWAIAGRSETKLAGVRAEIGCPDLATIVADAHDDAALLSLCARTRVVISTVGPYALHGEPLVRSCAQTGTDYADLTAEVPWMAQMIERYQVRAAQSGARLVFCCGFDSVPSDLGVAHLQSQARTRFGTPCQRVAMRIQAMRGRVSGGTVATMTNMARQLRDEPGQQQYITDPYSICPADKRPTTKQRPVTRPFWDRDAKAWGAPFVMAAVNEHVVHRTNALAEPSYGTEFSYNEAQLTGRGLKGRAGAYGLAGALGTFMAAVSFQATRNLLERFVLPAPGQGPNATKRANGFFDVRFHGHTPSGDTVRTRVRGDRDPGYGATSRIFGEAGLCLACDNPGAVPGGFWTPASLMAEPLTARLERHAGVTFVADE